MARLFLLACLFAAAAAEDIALHKPAVQYDVAFNGPASRAVDGNADTNYFHYHCTHTNVGKDATQKNWWAVNLKGLYAVNSVSITNRADCCHERLADFDIVVTNTEPSAGKQIVYSPNEVCAHKKGAMGKGATETFACHGVGQYVAIVQSRQRYLTLCGVSVSGELADTSEDVAEKKPAMQYDIAFNGPASRAVDGNADTNYFHNHCTHTNVGKDATKKNWWAVDLTEPYLVNSVAITNRADCCSERLADFDIVVTDTAPVPGHQLSYHPEQVCYHKTGAMKAGETATFQCYGDGRYVAIVQSRTRYLTLCSVKVFGDPAGGEIVTTYVIEDSK